MCKIIENLLYLLMGGVLIISGAITVNYLQRSRKKKDFIKCVLTEFRDLQFIFALVAYRMRHYLGRVEDDLFTWLLPIIEKYNGPEKDVKEINAFRKLSELTYQQRVELLSIGQLPGKSPRPETYHLPFIENNLSTISLFSIDLQRQLFEIKRHVDFYNNQAYFAQNQFNLTFDPNTDHEAININLRSSYESLANRAKTIVDTCLSA